MPKRMPRGPLVAAIAFATASLAYATTASAA